MNNIPTDTHIYTDGSYNVEKKKAGYGAVIIVNGKITAKLTGSCSREDYLASRNIYGETEAVLEAIRWAKARGIACIAIHHDYTGVAEWARGGWKANAPLARHYLEQYSELTRDGKISVSFIKVKAHSNNIYNDIADELAKKGAEFDA